MHAGIFRDANVRVVGVDPEPASWPDDGGAKRAPIYDRNGRQPRLVRKVGWVNCLGRFSRETPHRIFSPDVVRVRMCDRCKKPTVISAPDEDTNN
jgi:hypothetical protein